MSIFVSSFGWELLFSGVVFGRVFVVGVISRGRSLCLSLGKVDSSLRRLSEKTRKRVLPGGSSIWATHRLAYQMESTDLATCTRSSS
jgi:hypothetical protein